MAYLSSYLSGSGGGSSTPRMRSTYAAPRPYQPYTVARRGVQGIEQQANPYQGQDLSSALLMQRQISKASNPDTNFQSQYNYDPILAKIQALSTQTVNNAQTNAAELRKQALIASGATGIGSTLGFDAATLSAAGQNPESDYATLQRDYQQRLKDAAEAASANNTLYSGDYVDLLNKLAAGEASAQGAIGENLRNMLAQIDSGVLTAQDTARQQELDAQQAQILQQHYLNGKDISNAQSSGFSSGSDWLYGAQLPKGVSAESIYSKAQGYAPTYGGVQYIPLHIMNQGQIQNGMIAIKYVDPTGVNPSDTVWIPIQDLIDAGAGGGQTSAAPPPNPNAPTQQTNDLLASLGLGGSDAIASAYQTAYNNPDIYSTLGTRGYY